MNLLHANRYLITAAMLVITWPTESALAEALLADPQEKATTIREQTVSLGTAVTGAGNSTPINSNAESAQKMSCWQYGKLIFEHSVFPPKDKMSNMRILLNPVSGTRMQFFDFKTSFCVIK